MAKNNKTSKKGDKKMLTKIKNQETMKKLRMLFPMKTGKELISMLNFYLLDENGDLIIDEDVLEEVEIGNHEMLVKASKKVNPEGVEINIEEMYFKL